ncbi:L-lactate dehydrogenase [beta proteobacterium AAP121]|nr:L-lactate dehydrogenase [beta proteobacterium AAP65]KPF98243.1 L-lactate dehydrogenase [beta proteobacterium AAP121]
MHRRVGIIGTGSVGTSVAVSTLHAGVASALWLHDLNAARAEGEAMDLAHGAAFYPPCEVRSAMLAEMRECQVVVVAAGRNSRPGETRLDLLRDNARVIATIGQGLAGFGGTVVLVTNPVDVLTLVMQQASGLPPERVLGTGTMLDTARLHQMLGAELGVATQSIHAQVLGEHGDSELVLWSGAQVGGVPLRQWAGWTPEAEARLAHAVRVAAYEVIQRKGATNHAIGLVTARLLQCLLRGERRVLTVSRVQQGACGLHGVALSLPTVVGAGGGVQVLVPQMDATEQAALAHSAQVLQAAAASVAG